MTLIKAVITGVTLAIMLSMVASRANASCTQMQQLAREHSDDMARRHNGHCRSKSDLDHDGFTVRAGSGARAENVACASSASAAKALWLRSKEGHRENMMLPYRCKPVVCVGKFCTMEIGPSL